jgi:hypothetical protein
VWSYGSAAAVFFASWELAAKSLFTGGASHYLLLSSVYCFKTSCKDRSGEIEIGQVWFATPLQLPGCKSPALADAPPTPVVQQTISIGRSARGRLMVFLRACAQCRRSLSHEVSEWRAGRAAVVHAEPIKTECSIVHASFTGKRPT